MTTAFYKKYPLPPSFCYLLLPAYTQGSISIIPFSCQKILNTNVNTFKFIKQKSDQIDFKQTRKKIYNKSITINVTLE